MVNKIILGLAVVVMIAGGTMYLTAGIFTTNDTTVLVEKGIKMWALFVLAGGTILVIIGLVKKG